MLSLLLVNDTQNKWIGSLISIEIGQSLLEDQAKYDIFRENSKELDGLRWEKEQSDKVKNIKKAILVILKRLIISIDYKST